MGDWADDAEALSNLIPDNDEDDGPPLDGEDWTGWGGAILEALDHRNRRNSDMATQTKERVKIITPEFRVSFPQVFQARKINENDPNEKAKFSVLMLFRIKETAKSKELGEKVVNIDELKGAVRKILFDKFRENWRAKTEERKADGSKVIHLPFRDGMETGKKDKDGFGEGVVFCSASTLQRPGLIDGQKKEIMTANEFYGGCYARAEINPYWYNYKNLKQGVSLGLQNLQKIRDGEPFSGRSKPEEAFDAIEPPEGAAPAGAGAGAVRTDDPMGL